MQSMADGFKPTLAIAFISKALDRKAISDTYHQEQKDVLFYSNKLHLSPKNLSGILKKETGLSAKQNIDDFIIWKQKVFCLPVVCHKEDAFYE
ncbi:MAG: hypothetical protein H7122_19440 [Chitinophagaceae bacterium]|nr:hypothetical protein [Chitinophagaceae bacterium]